MTSEEDFRALRTKAPEAQEIGTYFSSLREDLHSSARYEGCSVDVPDHVHHMLPYKCHPLFYGYIFRRTHGSS